MKTRVVDASEIADRTGTPLLARDYVCSDGSVVRKYDISLDFDGVLHSATSPYVSSGVIPDPPTPGALEFVQECLRSGLSLAVSSCRAHDPEGKRAIEAWLNEYGFPNLEVTSYKLFADIYVDDKAYRFMGSNWPPISKMRLLRSSWTKTAK